MFPFASANNLYNVLLASIPDCTVPWSACFNVNVIFLVVAVAVGTVSVGFVLSILITMFDSSDIFPASSVALNFTVSFLSAVNVAVDVLDVVSNAKLPSDQLLLLPANSYFTTPEASSVDVNFTYTELFVQAPDV